jgi:hypothetical protein
VLEHDPSTGRLAILCFMDRPTDQPLAAGQHVIVAATRSDDIHYSARMLVEDTSDASPPTIMLRMEGGWQPEQERRHQGRIRYHVPATRARRWTGGAWQDLDAQLVDLSSRGVGLVTDRELGVGDRLALVFPLGEGESELRVNAEVRHVRPERGEPGHWRAGGFFRGLPPADHERIIRFIFAEMRSSPTS